MTRASSRRHTWSLHGRHERCRAAYQRYLHAEVERVRGVGTVNVSHDQRAGLDDAVDHAGIEREVVDAERLVQIRERRGELLRDPVAHVDVQLLQLVEHVRQLIGRRHRAARGNRVEVIAFGVAESYENRASVLRPMRGGVA